MEHESSSASTSKKHTKVSGLSSLQGACPVCGETLITIESNTVIFSQSHTIVLQESNGNITIKLYHGDKPTAMHPGPVLLGPWIVVESMDIRPL